MTQNGAADAVAAEEQIKMSDPAPTAPESGNNAGGPNNDYIIDPKGDSVLQSLCRKYGTLVGRYPKGFMVGTLLVYVIIIAIGFGREGGYMNEDPMELQWSETGGKLEKGVRHWLDRYDYWGEGNPATYTSHIAMFVDKSTPKPMKKDEEMTDIATVRHFTEMLDIYKEIHALTIEIPNPAYGSRRLLEEEANAGDVENDGMLRALSSNSSNGTTAAPTTLAPTTAAPTTPTPTTTAGPTLTYSYYDLCYRGVLPDLPAGSVQMPCMVISPLGCFKEAGDVNHPVYQYLDPNIQSLIPTQIPFSTRPSLLNATFSDTNVKEALSASLNPAAPLGPVEGHGSVTGCFGDSVHKKYSNELMSGKTEWYNMAGGGVENNANRKVKRASGYRSIFMLESVQNVAYRMQVMKPGHNAVHLIKKAQVKMNDLIHNTLLSWNDRSQYVQVSNLPPRFADDFEEEVKKGDSFLLFLGFAFNFFFCCYTLVHYGHPQASRASVGLSGLFLIVWSEFAAFGLYLALGRDFNGPMILALPVLGLGIGLDDMFVLIRYFSGLGFEMIVANKAEDVTGETFKHAGVGTTLTSVCNVLAFGCGCFLPIPAMGDFCLGAAILAIVNYITNVNILLPLLRLEINRIAEEKPDPHCLTYFCHKRTLEQQSAISKRTSITATSASGFTNSWEKRTLVWLKECYAPTLCRPVVAGLLTGVAGLLMTLSIMSINDMTVGWEPQSLLAEDHYLNRGMELVFEVFSTFSVQLFFVDTDIPGKQVEILQLIRALTDTMYTDPGMAPNLLTLFYLIQFAGYQAATAASMPANATSGEIAGATIGALMASPLKLDMSYTDPAFAPFGTFTTDSDDWYQVYDTWKAIPSDPIQAWNKAAHGYGFIYADIAGANKFHYNADGKIDFFTVDLFNAKLDKETKFLDMIRDTNRVLADSNLRDNAYVYGPIPVYWEVFMGLDEKLATLLWIDMGLVFAITFFFFEFDVLAAIITAVCCGMIVVQAYGLCCAMMSFNIFVAVFILMAMGMSVEFTCHFAAAFSMGAGSDAPIVERLGEAMTHVFPALTEGICSTILSVLPLAFHATKFTQNYVFGIIMIVVGAGTINGMIFMPAMLSLLDPIWKGLFPSKKKLDGRVQEIEEKNAARRASFQKSQELKTIQAA